MEEWKKIGNLLVSTSKYGALLTILDSDKNRFLSASMDIREIASLVAELSPIIERAKEEKNCLLCVHYREYSYNYCGKKHEIRKQICRENDHANWEPIEAIK